MKKSVLFLVLVFVFAALCLGANPADSYRENYVLLRDYLDRCVSEQTRYIDTRFNSIDRVFDEKQRALEVGSSVLDAKFVKIDDFIKRSAAFDSELSSLGSRTTILETNAQSQKEQAEFQKDQASAMVARWGLGLGVFFALLNILIAIFISRKNGKDKQR